MRSETKAVELATMYLPFLRTISRQYRYMGIDREDLFQIGYIGLYKAALTFDGDKGTFTAYCLPFLKKEYQQAFMSRGCIRIPLSVRRRIKLILKTIADLKAQTGREPDVSEIADKTGLPERKVINAIYLSQPVTSLNTHCYYDDEDSVLIEKVISDTLPDHSKLYKAILKLSRRERYVILQSVIYRKSYTEIGSKFGLSHTAIGSIKNRALGKLRRILKGEK